MVKIVMKDIIETKKFGIRLGKLLKGGEVISLIGDLGAGKTTLTKYIGQGLGITEYITSPTFTLINEYKGRLNLYHFDVYRLHNVEELLDIGCEEYFYSGGVTVVEWGNMIEDILPKDKINISMEMGNKPDERVIILWGEGNNYERIIGELSKN